MTDYGELAKNLISDNFEKLGTFGSICEYQSRSNSSYSTTSGIASEGPIVSSQIYMVFVSASKAMVDDSFYQTTDRQVLIPSKDLSVVPEVNDTIIDTNGLKWTVITVLEDPKPALYKLSVRPRYEP